MPRFCELNYSPNYFSKISILAFNPPPPPPHYRSTGTWESLWNTDVMYRMFIYAPLKQRAQYSNKMRAGGKHYGDERSFLSGLEMPVRQCGGQLLTFISELAVTQTFCLDAEINSVHQTVYPQNARTSRNNFSRITTTRN